jgi:hypothetical protein
MAGYAEAISFRTSRTDEKKLYKGGQDTDDKPDIEGIPGPMINTLDRVLFIHAYVLE